MNKFPCLINDISINAAKIAKIAFVIALNIPAIAWAQPQPKIVYISPQGADVVGAGSPTQAFRTITAAIAANPEAGTIFQLAAGNYSAATGENFPIRLPKGTILRGNSNANNVVISGGGRFVSPTFASQNIAIAAASDSRIEGITIINSNPRGYGLWLESSRNVVITNNNFVRNTHDGIFLTGNANAYIGNNLFAGNTGSGISALGTSSGEIRDNRFENTGFGLSIGQQSQVVLINNNISRNVDGIVISNTAQPTLRNNAIFDNQRNGLVVLPSNNGAPQPDLGTRASQGNNIFRNNREYDINNATTIPLSAVGNQISRSRVNGLIDLTASVPPSNSPIASIKPLPSIVNPPAIPSQTPKTPKTIFIPKPPSQALPNPVISVPPSAAPKTESPMVITIEREYPATLPTNPPNVAALPPVTIDPTTGKPFQYRVVVSNTSITTSQQVKAIVPDAFRISRNGRILWQVGAYSDRPAADAMIQRLSQSGVNAEIISFR